MSFQGNLSYINLAEPLRRRITDSIQTSEVASTYAELNSGKVPSSQLLKILRDDFDELVQNITIDNSLTSVNDLPPPSPQNNGFVKIINGEVYVSDGTQWLSLGQLKGEKGDQGEQGEKGIQGERGERGEQGVQGVQGEKGDKGDIGLTGLKGDKGDKGEQGEKGDAFVYSDFTTQQLLDLKGDKGDKGDTGERGEKGETGDQGIQGIQGERGEKGEKGDKGDRGEQGIQGIQGERGEKGDQGEQGEKGDTPTIAKSYPTITDLMADQANPDIPNGSFVIITSVDPDNDPDNAKVYIKMDDTYTYQFTIRGLQGEKGDRGEKGERGDQGLQGIQGVQGEKGEKGDKGDKGDQGIQGVAGVQGIQGEQGLKGDKGDKGDRGEQGVQGEKGEKGDKGDKGDQGLQGEKGYKGDTGAQGRQGVQGVQGEKGDKGDSASVRVLGTVATEAMLPRTGKVGQAYWTRPTSEPENEYLYIWSEDPELIVNPGWVRGSNLKGARGQQGLQGVKGDKGDKGDRGEQGVQGVQGLKGEKGEKGDKGDSAVLQDATTTSKGVMQVGDGLTVNDGIVSVRPKMLYAKLNNHQQVTAAGQKVVADNVLINDGYTYNANTGEFMLEQGKRYKIEFVTAIFDGQWAQFRLSNSSNNDVGAIVGIVLNTNHNQTFSSQQGLTLIFEPPTTGNYNIQTNGQQGSPSLRSIATTLLITEV